MTHQTTGGAERADEGYPLGGLWLREHRVTVPMAWEAPDGRELTVFAREVCDPERRAEDLPLLLYLQGGPGGAAPRPLDRSGWLGEAIRHYRVVLLDQRGTGRSSPVDGAVLTALGSAERGAAYLAHFRADAIVADAEHLRRTVYGGRRWATLGQSYGGFLTLAYLSRAPEALTACYVTGGLPGLPPDAAEVYRRTYPRVAAKNRQFYDRYPQDVERAAAVADLLAEGGVRLPDGDELTVRRFQTLGLDLGMKPGAERLHWLLDEAFAAPGRLSDAFLQQVLVRTSAAANPLFWTMQETIYADDASGATGWAAQRERARHPHFDPDARPLYFTGEMAYPWMLAEIRALRPFRPAVEALAARADFGPLYDLQRLAANEVPVAAAVYFDDMYVDAHLQLATAERLGNTRVWVTNEYEHDGIGDGRVLARLRESVRDRGGELR
ncbi:alpha/beta fold hydrolase [Streptomyces sp. 3MP-14]|uniref:Alpha/beta fold hydrolase n=1 Tax=Streptomyces mimosae TaxID=2586635 RepID=A0A5N6AML5_9ACTN|nr:MULTISPECIES: alpha/beta fold hydrolase [Streptomyces]KAB8169874.1 alpha/beta fold hydrolase [Streptomyces mimosae]KAB8178622.1 alpha/beta fold hydrolase [Streptomyces sp. 3MP-14]